MDGKAWLEALLGEELVTRKARVRPADVVFLKSVLEASEGLGAVFAEPRSSGSGDGGNLVIAAPRSRARDLEETLNDLRAELGVLELETPAEPF